MLCWEIKKARKQLYWITERLYKSFADVLTTPLLWRSSSSHPLLVNATGEIYL